MRAIIVLAGVAMVASFFAAWLEFPFAGPSVSPVAIWTDPDLTLLGPDDWRSWVLLAGFVCAALAVVMAVIGSGGGITATLAGLAPVVILVSFWLDTEGVREVLAPLPIQVGDVAQMGQVLGDFLRVGFYAYVGSALILLIAGLSQMLGRR